MASTILAIVVFRTARMRTGGDLRMGGMSASGERRHR